MKKRILSALLVTCMVLAYLPAFASIHIIRRRF